MGLVLYQIGEKRSINFGKLVISMLEDHAKKKPCKRHIGFPDLITTIIARKLPVITLEDVYCDVRKNIILNSKLFNEAVHVNDLPKQVGGKRKKLAENLGVNSDAVIARMISMSSRVLAQLRGQNNHLSKVIVDAIAKRK